MPIRDFIEDQGLSPALVTDCLRTTPSEIAATRGLGGMLSCAHRESGHATPSPAFASCWRFSAVLKPQPVHHSRLTPGFTTNRYRASVVPRQTRF